MAGSEPSGQSVALRQIAKDAPAYQYYTPLNPARKEIRLLDLQDEQTCVLRKVSLMISPVYFALSYYWGPPASTKPLHIKSVGGGRAQTVQIRKTVARFIKALYRQYGAISVWLDVLCINQRSHAEQSAQVAMMGDIFKRAKRVYAWMGKMDPDIEYTFNYVRADTCGAYTDTFDTRKVLETMETLFLRPYWTRFVHAKALLKSHFRSRWTESGSYRSAS